jgi:integrase
MNWKDTTIKAFPAPAGAPERHFERSADPELKGFGLQVTKTGARGFFLAYTAPVTGKRRTMSLGLYPTVSLAEARNRCREARRLLAKGIDPTEQREADREAARAEREAEQARGTVADLFDLYLTNLKRNGRTRGADEAKTIYDRDIGPVIGAMKARDVTPDHVADILARVLARAQKHGHTGVTIANRTRSYLRAAFEMGRQRRRKGSMHAEARRFDLRENPVDDTAPEEGERPRDRHLSPDELRTVWFGLAEPYQQEVTVTAQNGNVRRQTQTWAPDPLVALAVRWLLATGQRVEEVLGARWSEIDEAEALWVIPAERRKNRAHNASREPHLVPLTGLHQELLREIAERRVDGSPWLFPSPKDPEDSVSSSTLAQAVRRFCDRTGLDRFQPRDLRRTWKTLAGRAGIDLEIRNRIQGHAMQDVGSRHYDRWGYLPEKRGAMERWGKWLALELAGNPRQGSVVPIRAREATQG